MATSRASPPRTRRSAENAAANASRYVSRASVGSSGSSRLAASSSSGGASRPRVIANVICACNSWARACSSSSRGPALATASSRSAAVVRAGPVLRLCGEERTLCPAPRIWRQFDGALVECRPRRQAASRSSPVGRALQFGGDVLVEPGRRVREVPGAAIGVDVGIGGFGQRPVNALSLLRRCRALHRRTHERMGEAHLRAEIDQSGGGGRPSRVRPDAELRGRPPHQHRIPQRLCRGDEKQKPCRGRQRRQPLREALLDPPRQRPSLGQPEPAGELDRRQATWQLEQRQRVAARLGDEPIAHALVKRTGDHGRE